MNETISTALALLRLMEQSALVPLGALLLYSLPAVLMYAQKNIKLRSGSWGRVAMADMAAFVVSNVIMAIYALYLALHPEQLSVQMLEVLRTQVGQLIAMLSFLLCILVLTLCEAVTFLRRAKKVLGPPKS